MESVNPGESEYPRRHGPFILVSHFSGGTTAGSVYSWLVLHGRGQKLGVLKRCKLQDVESKKRFVRRAQLALNIEHKNIAATIAAPVINGELHILEEYIPGYDANYLQDYSEHTLNPSVAVVIAFEVANALIALEAQGLIHRDIAPENIRISREGVVKLLDLGLATSPEFRDSTLTGPHGVVYGRQVYAAPEVLQGHPATSHTDLYSLGVVFWELLAKQRFFKHAQGTSPAVCNPEVEAELDAIALRAVSDLPEERFATAAEFQAALIPHLAKLDPAAIMREALAVPEVQNTAFHRAYDENIAVARAFAKSKAGKALFKNNDSQATAVIDPAELRRELKRQKTRQRAMMFAPVLLLLVAGASLAVRGHRGSPIENQVSPVKPTQLQSPRSVSIAAKVSPPVVQEPPAQKSPPIVPPKKTRSLSVVQSHPLSIKRAVLPTPPQVALVEATVSDRARASEQALHEAKQLLQAGQLMQAEAAAAAVVATGATPTAYTLLAKCQRASGKVEEERTTIARGLAAFPNDPVLMRLSRRMNND